MTNKHGGKREGAGRPTSGHEDHHLRCSPEEWEAVKKLLKDIRNPSK